MHMYICMCMARVMWEGMCMRIEVLPWSFTIFIETGSLHQTQILPVYSGDPFFSFWVWNYRGSTTSTQHLGGSWGSNSVYYSFPAGNWPSSSLPQPKGILNIQFVFPLFLIVSETIAGNILTLTQNFQATELFVIGAGIKLQRVIEGKNMIISQQRRWENVVQTFSPLGFRNWVRVQSKNMKSSASTTWINWMLKAINLVVILLISFPTCGAQAN